MSGEIDSANGRAATSAGAEAVAKNAAVLRQEIAIEELEMNGHPTARFRLEPRGFDKGHGKLISVGRGVA